MRYTVQVALTERNGPESEFRSDNMVDCQLLYRALREVGCRPIRILENGYHNQSTGEWFPTLLHWSVENGIETVGAPRNGS